MSDDILHTPQRQQRETRAALRQLNIAEGGSPRRRRIPNPRPETPTPLPGWVERVRTRSRASVRESRNEDLQSSPRRRRPRHPQDENEPPQASSSVQGAQGQRGHALQNATSNIHSSMPSIVTPRREVQLPPSKRSAGQLRRFARLREERNSREGPLAVEGSLGKCSLGIDIPHTPTPPSSRMVVGAIQQLASTQQIQRSINNGVAALRRQQAPARDDRGSHASTNMPPTSVQRASRRGVHRSAVLSALPATQEASSTQTMIRRNAVQALPRISAVSPLRNEQRSTRLHVRGSATLPTPPATQETSSSTQTLNQETAAQAPSMSAVSTLSTMTMNERSETPNARSLGQRRRRERERQQRQQQNVDRGQNEQGQQDHKKGSRVRVPRQDAPSTPVSRAGRAFKARVLDARAESTRQRRSPQPEQGSTRLHADGSATLPTPFATQKAYSSTQTLIQETAAQASPVSAVSTEMTNEQIMREAHSVPSEHAAGDNSYQLNHAQANVENNIDIQGTLHDEDQHVDEGSVVDDNEEEEEEQEDEVARAGQRIIQDNPAPPARHRRVRHQDLFCIARKPYQDVIERHYLGHMDVPCPDCGAMHWLAEKLASSSQRNPRFGTCCSEDRVCLPALEAPPEPLHTLLSSDDRDSKSFREDSWKYNRALAFTSLGVTEDHSINQGQGQPVFRICGDLCHNSGALVPSGDKPPRYAQLYIYEPRAALESRMAQNQSLSRNIMQGLQDMLLQHHQYAPIFKHAHEILRDYDGPVENAEVRLRVAPGLDKRRYNLPTADEVAVILPGAQSKAPRDIVLRNRAGPLYQISDLHPAYAPLQYPLLFPRGENGWHPDMVLHESTQQRQTRLQQAQQRQEKRNWRGLQNNNPTHESQESRRLTLCRYVAFRIHSRPGEYSALLHGGRLFTRYMVDMFACLDQSRLRYLEDNQPQIRAAHFSGLEDAMVDDGDAADLHELGQRIILPSSYIGGPRHMTQRFQDAMAIARYFRKVDIFLTMTTNPQWKEIEGELLPGQTAYDRPDLVARVFQMKKDALIDYIYKYGLFGKAVAYVYTIEFQKRGLPHIHLLIFLKEPYKLLTPEAIDSCIWARWPDPDTQPLLFETIKRCMVHGPCGALNLNAPCMVDGKCSKGYPKNYQEFTSMDQNGYPLYFRPNDGRKYKVGNHWLDNRWIVPYPPWPCAFLDCHINTECAISIGSIKYPFKYIHKGPDRALLEYQHDEIRRWIDGRYISPPEATWRIFQFEMHNQIPPVVRLQIHLEGHHMVTFNPDDNIEDVVQRGARERTTLTAYFEANLDPGLLGIEARKHTYQEFPQYFTWDNASGKVHPSGTSGARRARRFQTARNGLAT